MNAQSRLKRLRDIVAVRAAQRDGARLGLARADAAVAASIRKIDAENARQVLRQTEWDLRLSAPRLDPELVGLWAAAIWRGAADLTGLAAGQQAAEAERETAKAEWRLATGRLDGAEVVLTAAARRRRRLMEEAQLAEIADRAARERRTP